MPVAAHKAAISVGLIYIPVSLYTAIRSGGVSFNQLHKDTHARIKYKKVREDTGAEVAPNEIVKGYQYDKGRYVVITDDELERIKTPKDRNINILYFVDSGSVDPIFYDKTYFSVPDGGNKAFELLRQSMLAENKIAIAKSVIGTKEKVLCLMPDETGIVIESLHYLSEVQAMPQKNIRPEVSEAELNMGKMLVSSMVGSFKPEEFRDEYAERVMSAIETKIHGGEIVAASAQQPNNVIDLMEALQKSIAMKKTPELTGARA